MLPERADAISLFQPHLQALVLDAIYNILKLTVSAGSDNLRKTLSSSESVDPAYLQRIVETSRASQTPEEAKQATEAMQSVAIGAAQQRPPSPKNKSLDALLADYEEDMGMEDMDALVTSNIAAEVNLLKQ